MADKVAVQNHAHDLMQRKEFEKALATYRELAVMDPGSPGVNLDISMALSKLKQPVAARIAVASQLTTSECLSRLPTEALNSYCASEMFDSPLSCLKELTSIQQGATIQATLVQMDLGREGSAKRPVESASVQPEAFVRSQASTSRAATPNQPKVANAKGKIGGPRNSLASGEGTDAALGAYSK
jgi:hypothetical protein